jgi:cobyrinic acid a,c-diamide synthase
MTPLPTNSPMKRLLISAAHKSSGKTTISIGLCKALADQGDKIQPYKKGPDYIDPMWLGRAANRACYNLDFYTMQRDEILAMMHRYSASADISLIEGNKGLYDGLDLEGSNSNAALARLTHTPVILVIDVQGMTRGIAPLVLGYQAFDPELHIAGIILNQIRGLRHESKLRAVLEHYTNVPVLGAVQHDKSMAIVERHLGLVPSNESRGADERIAHIGQLIAQQVDLDNLRQIASASPTMPETRFSVQRDEHAPDVRIAVARDAAFGFYYPDDLEALQAAGAQLISFNALEDATLPDCDGLFIGGGFPETHMAALEANQSLRTAIKAAIDNGLPTYAECGGLMYLARKLNWQDKSCEMVGVISGDISMHARPMGRGYIQLQQTPYHPWPGGPDDATSRIPGHEFHYSALDNLPANQDFAYHVRRGTGIDGQHDGLIYKNLLASYAHLRDTSQHHWAKRFVSFVRTCKSKNSI